MRFLNESNGPQNTFDSIESIADQNLGFNAHGSLVLGGFDQSRFVKPSTTDPSLTFPFYTDISRDLLVGVSSIRTTNTLSSGAETSLLDQSFHAFIDSTVPHLWLPETVCKAFEDAFGLTWDSESELYILSAEQHSALINLNPNITFDLTPTLPAAAAGQVVPITLPYSAFDLNVSWPFGEGVNDTEPRYYFPLKRAANETQYTLGRAFLQEAYLIADYERQNFSIWPCAWDDKSKESHMVTIFSNSTANQTSTTNSADAQPGKKKLGAGAIAGIAVGGFIGILALAIGIFWGVRWYMCRRRRAKRSAIELQRGQSDTPANSFPSYHPHRVASVTELGGTTRLELQEDHRFEAPGGGRFEMEGEGLPHEVPGNEKEETYEMDAGGDGIGGLHGISITVEPATALSPRPESVMPSPVSGTSTMKYDKEDFPAMQTTVTDKSSEKDGVRSFFGFIKAFRASGKS